MPAASGPGSGQETERLSETESQRQGMALQYSSGLTCSRKTDTYSREREPREFGFHITFPLPAAGIECRHRLNTELSEEQSRQPFLIHHHPPPCKYRANLPKTHKTQYHIYDIYRPPLLVNSDVNEKTFNTFSTRKRQMVSDMVTSLFGTPVSEVT